MVVVAEVVVAGRVVSVGFGVVRFDFQFGGWVWYWVFVAGMTLVGVVCEFQWWQWVSDVIGG